MITQYSNSFAAPYISAIILNDMTNEKKMQQSFVDHNWIAAQSNSLYYQFNGCLNVAIICSDRYEQYVLENFLNFNVVYKGTICAFLEMMIADKSPHKIDTYIIIDWDGSTDVSEVERIIEFQAQHYIIFKQKYFDCFCDKQISKNILLQQEEIFSNLTSLNELKRLDIPIVCIAATKADTNKLLKVVLNTRNEFFEHDYNCRCISNISLFGLYDINYLENITIDTLKAAIDFYNIDILIFAIATDVMTSVPKVFDEIFCVQEFTDHLSLFKQIVSLYSIDENSSGGSRK